jgi:hypothetical protein
MQVCIFCEVAATKLTLKVALFFLIEQNAVGKAPTFFKIIT